MKILPLLIWTSLFSFANTAEFALASDDNHVTAKPGWLDFHLELERSVALEVKAARSEAEELYKGGIRARREYAPGKVVTGETRNFPENLVDAPTLMQLSSALRRPIPAEQALRNIFQKERVPEELIYVGLVESGYNNNSVSGAGAVGPWQFIAETGRRYGLKQGSNGDERRDLLKSTKAAARYLRDLYDLLGDWNLALAGYNAGENRILKAMRTAGTSDFWSLRYLLPAETAEYVPRVLAAISIAEKMRIGKAETEPE